jgi:hypothetical protein
MGWLAKSTQLHIDCVAVKNITLAVDESILRAVRRYAEEQGSSLNRLVRDYLADIAAREGRAADARRRLRQLSDASPARIGKARRPRRDEIHDR